MSFVDIASWAVFGSCVHGLAQGLARKPLNYKPVGYLVSAGAFVVVGMLVQSVRNRQSEFINRRISLLERQRLERGVTFRRE